MVETHIHSNFSALRGRLRRLPPIHQTTFRALIEHLGRVNSHVGQNKMDAKVRYTSRERRVFADRPRILLLCLVSRLDVSRQGDTDCQIL